MCLIALAANFDAMEGLSPRRYHALRGYVRQNVVNRASAPFATTHLCQKAAFHFPTFWRT